MKQNLALQFCRNRNKDVSTLTETHINYDQIHHIRNNWLGAIFFSPGDSHTKGLEGVIKVDIDPKMRFVSFKVTSCNDRVLCRSAPSGHSTSKQLIRTRFFEGLQDHMENKNEGDENKIILGDFICIGDKVERDGGNKTFYRCRFSYALSKLIVENVLEDLWRRENPDSSVFIHYDSSSGTRSRIDRIDTDIKIASNTKINHIMIFFTDRLTLFLLTDSPQKLKLEKIHGILIIFIYVSLSSP